MGDLTHFDDQGNSQMVDVGAKQITVRTARASARVCMAAQTVSMIRDRQVAKGDVLGVARLAGIMAAKRTAELIPLCHALSLDTVSLDFDFPDDRHVAVLATARATARTGVEMEALVAASVAALVIYDMCKSADRGMVIEETRLEEKLGGRSGHFLRSP